MKDECYACHLKTVEKLTDKFKLDTNDSSLLLNGTAKLLRKHKESSNPNLATAIHRLAKNIIKNINLYEQEKLEANKLLMSEYDAWEKLIKTNKNSFNKAAKLAVIGNVIDYGAHAVSDNISLQINDLLKKELKIDESNNLFQKIKEAKSILYLGDNAGEIVFDKLFIETIQHPNITYVVRGKPIINDVTFNDVEYTGIDKICQVISNGYDAPSTLLEHCSEEFINAYESADLIISKGQGNFEGLMNSENSKIFFMLMAKCRPMAELLGVNKNDLVIKQLKTPA